MQNKFTSNIIPIILVFFIVNLAILFGGLESWFGFDLSHISAFIVIFIKLFLFLFVLKLILNFFNLDEHPLLIVGIVFSILVFFSNTYFQKYQNASYQKQTIGNILEIKASELHLKETLHKTPYLKITNSGIGEIKTFKKCINSKCNEAVGVYENFCYASILNTIDSVFIVEECDNNLLQNLSEKTEFSVELLLKKSYFSNLKGLQFHIIQKRFSEYYNIQYNYFLNFIKIINGIVLLFVLIYLNSKFFSKIINFSV